MEIHRQFQSNYTIGIIGAGGLGFPLARELNHSGYKVTGIWTRTFSRTEQLSAKLRGTTAFRHMQEVADNCQLVFITVPDDIISNVADSINWYNGQFVVHCSGIHPKEILQNPLNQGAIPGGFHPLQTFTRSKIDSPVFKGITIGIDAPSLLYQHLESIAYSLGGSPFSITGKDRTLYHASATIACALLVVLIHLAADLWNQFQDPLDSETDDGLHALIPLIKSTLNNLEVSGPVGALTGPLVRGDIGTITGHIKALEEKNPELRDIYGLLGIAALPLAKQKGNLTLKQIKKIRHLLRSGINCQKPIPENNSIL